MIKSGGGKRCDRKFRRKSKALLASVKRSPTTCSFRAPGPGRQRAAQSRREADRQGAQEDAGVAARRAPSSSSPFAPAVAGSATRCVSSRTRSASSSCAGPAGNGFPVKGKSNAIKKVNQRNQLRLIASRLRGPRAGQRRGGREGQRRQSRPGLGPQGPVRGRQPEGQGRLRRRHLQEGGRRGPRPLSLDPEAPDLDRDARATEDRWARRGTRRQLAGDRPQRRPQHLRPRRQARSPA